MGAFITDLKLLASRCEFGEERESLITNMVVFHGNDAELRVAFCENTNDLDLKRAVEI